MEQKNQIENADDLRLEFVVAVWLGEHHVQKIRREFVLRFGIDKGKSARFSISKRGNGANLREDKGGFFVKVLSLLRSKKFRVVATGGGDHRREHRHRVRVGRKSLEVKLHILVNQLVFCQQAGKTPKFGVRRK